MAKGGIKAKGGNSGKAGTVMHSHGTGQKGGDGKGHLKAASVAAFSSRPKGKEPR